MQLHRANEGAASARAISAFNYNICTGPAWEHRAPLPTQHRGHTSAGIPPAGEAREAPEGGQEGDTFSSVGTAAGLSCEGRCGGVARAVPVCRATRPHVGEHQRPGLVPVFMGSPCNQTRRAVSHQRFQSLSESAEKETFIT